MGDVVNVVSWAGCVRVAEGVGQAVLVEGAKQEADTSLAQADIIMLLRVTPGCGGYQC
jgi:hypothetical protein